MGVRTGLEKGGRRKVDSRLLLETIRIEMFGGEYGGRGKFFARKKSEEYAGVVQP